MSAQGLLCGLVTMKVEKMGQSYRAAYLLRVEKAVGSTTTAVPGLARATQPAPTDTHQ